MWTQEEIRCLIDIWSDKHIKEQLATTHKNSDIYALFSKHLRERLSEISEQCCVKAKKTYPKIYSSV